MRRGAATALILSCIVGVSSTLDGASTASSPASPVEFAAVNRFLTHLEKPPAAYRAHRRLEAASEKLKESAWMEAFTEFSPGTGFRYSVIAAGGSERIQRRVLKSVLEAERESSEPREWAKGILSHANYAFEFGGRADDGTIKMRLNPKRSDTRLVDGAAIVTAPTGDLVRVEGRLSKSPSFWVKWVDVSRRYAPVGGSLMPVAVESVADVRIAGRSTFSMTYTYQAIDGQAVNHAPDTVAAR
jgi:hypothetical protein